MFGHDASKKTCLWLKNLPALLTTNIVIKSRYANQTPSGRNNLPPSPDRWKLRSITYQGIADAMAEQWGAEHKDIQSNQSYLQEQKWQKKICIVRGAVASCYMTDWRPAVGEKAKMFIAVSIAITTLKYQKEYKMTKLEPWMTELMAKVKYQKYDEALELPTTKDLRSKEIGRASCRERV